MISKILLLPNELITSILNHLPYPSIIALQWTCRQLYTITKAHQHSQNNLENGKSYTMKDLLEIEKWPFFSQGQFNAPLQPIAGLDFFACYMCLKIRSAGCFSNAMMKGRRGKISLYSCTKNNNRFCIPCGVRSGSYIRGTILQSGGAMGTYGFVCYGCKCFIASRNETEMRERRCYMCLRKRGWEARKA